MLDNDMIEKMVAARARGHVIDVLTYESLIIPWGSDCCRGCEFYDSGRTITMHGYCPIVKRNVSPHYFCTKYEQD